MIGGDIMIIYYLDDLKDFLFIKTNKFHEIISIILIKRYVLKVIKKIKNLTKVQPTFLYLINTLNLWGFVFCNVNKKTYLNTFIYPQISGT